MSWNDPKANDQPKAFDPDAYLAKKQKRKQPEKTFDPDAYLAKKTGKPKRGSWQFQNPKTGETYDVAEEYDEQSRTDTAREKAISKGYVPIIDVVNPKTGESFQIDDRELEKALAKGYQTRENAQVQQNVAQDRKARADETIADGGNTLAAAKGFADTATFGFSDEIGGAYNALTGQGDYQASRDEQRRLSDSAKDNETGAYYTGMAGAILPTLGAAATKAPSLANMAKASAAEGAAFGAGDSTADLTEGEIEEFAADVGIGASIGAAIPVGMKGISKGASKVGGAIGDSKFGQAFKGGEAVRKFNDPNSQTDLANRLLEGVEESYQDLYSAGSKTRRKFTEEMGSQTPGTSSILDNFSEFAGRHGDDSAGGYSKLAPEQSAKLNQYLGDLTVGNPDAKTLYSMWDDLSRTKNQWESTLGNNTSEYSKRLGQLMKGIKSKLHAMSPELKGSDNALSEALAKKNLLKGAATNPESFLSTIGSRNKGNRRDAVYEMLAKKRPDLLKEVDNFQTYKQFQGQGGFGSDNGIRNALGIGTGGALGGIPGAIIGGALASPKNQMNLITTTGDMVKRVHSKLPSLPKKYQQALQAAAQRGGNATAVTHFLLSHHEPEYQRLMHQSEDDE